MNDKFKNISLHLHWFSANFADFANAVKYSMKISCAIWNNLKRNMSLCALVIDLDFCNTDNTNRLKIETNSSRILISTKQTQVRSFIIFHVQFAYFFYKIQVIQKLSFKNSESNYFASKKNTMKNCCLDGEQLLFRSCQHICK